MLSMPWYADNVNYLVEGVFPPEASNQLIRRCIAEKELEDILWGVILPHAGATLVERGHHKNTAV
ncbi:hypothetical protein EPI10_005281 [Gossypium australe]|uniref:Uncharacterized protein n=1 Tax=Gossypium australe TaxID=47621 RepID=A0A5B6WPG8_9ROSI|nr:hypothetical protein EPI10_005281 [Gossypium australe]